MIQSNRGNRLIQFIETLSIPEGMNAQSPFILRPWQQEIIQAVYAPVYKDSCWNGKCIGDACQKKKKQSCIRVVRKAIFSVAKKNGKTPIVAAIALGHLVGPEAKINEQILAGAHDRDQSGITFRYMSQMVYMDDELSSVLNVKQTKEISCSRTGSVFKALSAEVKGKHGLGPAVLIMDELAQFGANRVFYDTLAQGRGAHLEPLLWIISTQAADDLAVLSQEIDTALRVQEPGPDYDPTVKLFFFTTPKEADAYDPQNWKISNPAMGDFLNIADMEEAARTAKNMPSAESGFRNLRLNQRIDAAAHFISPDVWRGCGDELQIDESKERTWWAGLDLSQAIDLSALVLVSKAQDGKWDVIPYFWIPGDNLRDKEIKDRVPYCTWRDQGFLEAKPGKTIDYTYIAMKLNEILSQYNVSALIFDRWKIKFFRQEMEKLNIPTWIYGKGEGADWNEDKNTQMPDGLKMISHGQGLNQDMSNAVNTLEIHLREKLLRHAMHPVLTYCASNTVVIEDARKNRAFDKKKSIGHIDGIVALAMALNGAVTQEEEKESVYEQRGVLIL